MNPKIIKNDADLAAALARIDEIFDAKPGTPEGDELELRSLLVERYEADAFPVDLPDPLTAIRFRMEQQGLKPKDLVPYLGSASKVSEVLAGQRNLSLTMIRKLVTGLGIPAEVLLHEPGAKLDDSITTLGADKFPIGEMLKRGWFGGFRGSVQEARANLEDLLSAFAPPAFRASFATTFNRRHVRTGRQNDDYALRAWHIRVATLAAREELPAFDIKSIDDDFLHRLVSLSYFDEGPKLAREFLRKSGIHVIMERHLPKTRLDGAALCLPNGEPAVALTLRHDRLDNFWFTLLHELAHVKLHLYAEEACTFYDDLDEASDDGPEQQADAFAMEALVPASVWKSAGSRRNITQDTLVKTAERLRVHPAVLAGRVRFEKRNYRLFTDLLGHRKVRVLFEE